MSDKIRWSLDAAGVIRLTSPAGPSWVVRRDVARELAEALLDAIDDDRTSTITDGEMPILEDGTFKFENENGVGTKCFLPDLIIESLRQAADDLPRCFFAEIVDNLMTAAELLERLHDWHENHPPKASPSPEPPLPPQVPSIVAGTGGLLERLGDMKDGRQTLIGEASATAAEAHEFISMAMSVVTWYDSRVRTLEGANHSLTQLLESERQASTPTQLAIAADLLREVVLADHQRPSEAIARIERLAARSRKFLDGDVSVSEGDVVWVKPEPCPGCGRTDGHSMRCPAFLKAERDAAMPSTDPGAIE